MPTSVPTSFWKHLRAAQWLAPERFALSGKWLEVILIPALLMGAAWYWKPQDPLLIKSAFPWMWFAPVLVALRYGAIPGLISGFLILGNWLLANSLGVAAITQADFPRDFFFGGGLLILLCGEFSDVWRDRVARMDETNLYVTERLSRLTKRHLLLNLSHDRMEQEMLARPGSLRDALISVRNLVFADGQKDTRLPGLKELLSLLAQYVNIEAAAVYGVAVNGKAETLGPVAQSLGEPQPLKADDELLQLALEKRSLAHIAGAEVSQERGSNQLIVAPIIASDNSLVGVLAVTKLPFFSLSVENLQMMSVILAYYADHIHNAADVTQYRSRLPTIPATYAEELARMVRMERKVGITSHIAVMTFPESLLGDIPAQFLQIKRGLDLYWQTYVNGELVVAVLMPFASALAKDGFMQRIDGWLKLNYGGGFDTLKIRVRSIDIAREDPLVVLPEIMPS